MTRSSLSFPRTFTVNKLISVSPFSQLLLHSLIPGGNALLLTLGVTNTDLFSSILSGFHQNLKIKPDLNHTRHHVYLWIFANLCRFANLSVSHPEIHRENQHFYIAAHRSCLSVAASFKKLSDIFATLVSSNFCSVLAVTEIYQTRQQ